MGTHPIARTSARVPTNSTLQKNMATRGSSVTEKHRKTDHVHEALITDFAAHGQSESGLLIEPYRRELLLHCYRLLGALHDAEDAVQETMLRAWRHFDTFTDLGPGSLRTWLYTIATNTSLDILKKRSPRTLPTATSLASDPTRPVAPRSAEVLWLEPFPDSWLTEATENPEARYTRQESVSLAFLTALQLLPPRQRAILLLSDVLDWRAVEIAQLLEISVPAANSALHRARVTLGKNYHSEQREMEQVRRADTATNMLLARYLQAWETDDVDGLVALLKEDATLSMPPVPSWYQGREAIRTILLAVLFPSGVQKRWRLFPTRANGQPAFAVYRADEATGFYRAFALQVVALDGSRRDQRQVADVTAFLGPKLVTSFGFPLQLPQ
ncbi:RNA polymerase, sigma-24 subunit, ECF subfamily [Ktedonobacter racemifer DSM 44963]|uniref:RNA polymerase, sigma-24 subunit, ECF subfamily n=1 Tax=Ktedonobacter racemifer DSM 44963 TaxID=485913 RepID=D6TDB3_KTERA|nr:RNA polymerase, sigma-24 subunit, ECF subfamily [Ktedonobacter racemifer DSM 44963]